jgi:hypothetical protein
MLALLREYAAEPDMRTAMRVYNAGAPLARKRMADALGEAQRRRVTRAAPRCEICGEAMTVIGAGQTAHPMCEPLEGPEW